MRIIALIALITLSACGGEPDAPTASAPPPSELPSFNEDDVASGTCEEGLVRDCKVWIDDNNCFVGEQACLDGAWADCREAGFYDDLDGGDAGQ